MAILIIAILIDCVAHSLQIIVSTTPTLVILVPIVTITVTVIRISM